MNKQKRVLSNCIVSRWYRPPEIVLTQKHYDQAVDIWSMGCILAEMMYCTEEYNHDYNSIINNRYLFPGSSCFPISPCDEMKNQKGGEKEESMNIVSQNDQLIKILEIVGGQDERDLSFILDQGVIDYQKRIQKDIPKGSQLNKLFEKSNENLLNLLCEMLEFNPQFRPTAKECLKNPIFDDIRVPGLEKSAPYKINIDVDRNEYQFDYENLTNSNPAKSEKDVILYF